jgi:HEAT repeat protein
MTRQTRMREAVVAGRPRRCHLHVAEGTTPALSLSATERGEVGGETVHGYVALRWVGAAVLPFLPFLLVGTSLLSPAADAQTAARPEAADRGSTDSDEDTALAWNRGLESGLLQAQVDQRPALVLVARQGCPWSSRQLQELEEPRVRSALRHWTLVYIDAVEAANDLRRLGAATYPSIHLLRPTGAVVASLDGPSEAATLIPWLTEHHAAAALRGDGQLSGSDPPDQAAIGGLIESLGQRDPVIRQVVVQRLVSAPAVCGPAVIAALQDGNLATRLAALEVLNRWQAPLEQLDPWQPDTITAERLARLSEWLTEFSGSSSDGPSGELRDDQLIEARQEIERLLNMTALEGEAARAQLARFGAALLPEIDRQLEQAVTDQQREKLLALRYRLVAGDSLALRFPGGLVRLASTDASTRRAAAEQLVALATTEDQPLLLELFSDPDPLIREISLRGLDQLGGEQPSEALVRLLRDPELNVRAAVLKRLAESRSAAMLPQVMEYLEEERDPDLLVHAIRYLREVRRPTVLDALLPLLEHEAWQVRAEAAESLQGMSFQFDHRVRQLQEARMAQALTRLLDDPDALVVSRAIDALSGLRQRGSQPSGPLIDAARRLPELAPRVIGQLWFEEPAVQEFLEEATAHPVPEVRATALTELFLKSREKAKWTQLALADDSPRVRTAVAQRMFHTLSALRQSAPSNRSPRWAELGNWFGGPPPMSREESELQDPLDPRVLETFQPVIDPPATGDSRWSSEQVADWLARFHAGEGQPDWARQARDQLVDLLGSADSQERLAAAVMLAPLGDWELALPVIRGQLEHHPRSIAASADVLPWLPWEQRRELFQEMHAVAGEQHDGLAGLARALARDPDPRAIDWIWELLAAADAAEMSLESVYPFLETAYFGKPMSGFRIDDANSVPRDSRERALADSRQYLRQGTPLQQLAALMIHSRVDAEAVVAEAQSLLGNPETAEWLQTEAFRLLLVFSPPKERPQIAIQAVGDEHSQRRELALNYLVGGLSRIGSVLGRIDLEVHSDPSHDVAGFRLLSDEDMAPAAERLAGLDRHEDPAIRGYLGYLRALQNDLDGLADLLAYWRQSPGIDTAMLAVQAIAALDDSSQLPVLEEIYGSLELHEMRDYYWTIRGMTGPAMLEFRRKIRQEVGMVYLQ